jgi:steroid delta-isomerase-like uncharacterized protein
LSSARAEEVVQRLLAAWNSRDMAGFARCLADDVEWYDPAMPDPPARGQVAVIAFAESVMHAFPDFKCEVLPPMCFAADGSRVAIKWRIAGSHQHPLDPPGYAPTGRRAEFEGVDVLDLEGERVTRILTAFDPLPAAEQLLGMLLRPIPGTCRGWIAVRMQRALAWRARSRRRSPPTRG